MIKKIILLVILIVGVLPSTIVLANQIPPPSPPTIMNVGAYEGLFEPLDQLYLVEINIPVPSTITLTASQTFIVRIMNGSTTLGAANPITNPYYSSGYGEGVIGIYFSAADVSSNNMTWNNLAYSVDLLTSDNTSTTWNGTPPTTYTLASISNWYDTSPQTSLKNRIVYLGTHFKSVWGSAYTFITSGVLTSDGETYFTAAIPNLTLLCPIVFSSYTTPVIFNKPPALSVTYALTLRNQWLSQWLDLTTMAADFGIDAIWFYAALWCLVILAVCVGYIGFAGTNDSISFLVGVCIVIGGLIGFLPWSAAVLMIVVGGLSIFWNGFYKRSLA